MGSFYATAHSIHRRRLESNGAHCLASEDNTVKNKLFNGTEVARFQEARNQDAPWSFRRALFVLLRCLHVREQLQDALCIDSVA
jgi:hypothetical protein